jgi:Rnl2 family RNA ligase
MEFKKFNSIENAYQKTVIDQIFIHGFDQGKYVVQEKVHGANFSFFTDGVKIKIAKRTDFIQEDEKFYNAQEVLNKYQKKVIEIFEKVKNEFEDVSTVVIYGEIFGGFYPHKDVEKVENAIRVQKGIEYCPANDFYAYDIKINGTHFLPVAKTNEIFEEIGFFYAKTLFEGTLVEALNYPNTFNSFIPSWLGLPTLESNITEGTIIRPSEVRYFGNGSRVILKNKNEKWSEKSHEKRERKPQNEILFSEKAEKVWAEIQDYITINRLQNVLSKTGEFHPKLMGKIVGLMAQDVLEDFLKENPIGFDALEKEEHKSINKRTNNMIIKLIKDEYMTLKI